MSQNKIVTLKNGNPSVGNIAKNKEMGDLEKHKHQVGKSSSYSNNNIRVNYIDNINENNVVYKCKITFQGEVTSINEGDEESNEKN